MATFCLFFWPSSVYSTVNIVNYINSKKYCLYTQKQHFWGWKRHILGWKRLRKKRPREIGLKWSIKINTLQISWMPVWTRKWLKMLLAFLHQSVQLCSYMYTRFYCDQTPMVPVKPCVLLLLLLYFHFTLCI